jgi:Ala-tRNA(Pro) deacylase
MERNRKENPHGKEAAMLAKGLREYLDREHIRYSTLTHSPAYTAEEIAASAHIPGKNLAKTVMVKLDDRLAMAVLPATEKVDLERLREAAGARKAILAAEEEFKGRFSGYEIGAMPPFGHLHGMDVFVSATLAGDTEIAFNAGTHTDLVLMSYADFARLAHPKVVSFSVRH